MRFLPRLAAPFQEARRQRATVREGGGGRDHPEGDEVRSGGSSLTALVRAALKPGQTTWMVTRAVSLRAF